MFGSLASMIARRRGHIGLGAILGLMLATQAAADPLPLRYGQAYSTLRSIYSLPIVVAEHEGFFRREGLDFRVVVPVPGGSDKMIDALHDGVVDITHVAMPFLIRKALAGSDAVAIAAEFNNPIYSLMAKPGIKTFADLRGKVVTLAAFETIPARSATRPAARHGCSGGGLHAVGTLDRGDAGLSLYRYSGTALLGPDKEALVRYLRALRAAFQFIRDPQHRDTVIEIIAETTGVSKSVAANVLRLYFSPERGVLPREGEIDMAALAQVTAMMAEAGALAQPLPAPENFVDRQYLQAAGVK